MKKFYSILLILLGTSLCYSNSQYQIIFNNIENLKTLTINNGLFDEYELLQLFSNSLIYLEDRGNINLLNNIMIKIEEELHILEKNIFIKIDYFKNQNNKYINSSGKLEIFPDEFPAKYIVKEGECLSIISMYKFIYGNYNGWKILYESNKNLIFEHGNPDLILPQMILNIPSINGEKRNGIR